MKAIPPLLQLIEGRRGRPRKALAATPKEIALHMAVAGVLRRFIKPDWRWSHYPAGELRHPRTAAKLKAMGTMPGWPDLMLLAPDGRLHGLELKRRGSDLGEDQQDFQTWAAAHGVPYSVAWSMEDALAILGFWRCLRIDVADLGNAP